MAIYDGKGTNLTQVDEAGGYETPMLYFPSQAKLDEFLKTDQVPKGDWWANVSDRIFEIHSEWLKLNWGNVNPETGGSNNSYMRLYFVDGSEHWSDWFQLGGKTEYHGTGSGEAQDGVYYTNFNGVNRKNYSVRANLSANVFPGISGDTYDATAFARIRGVQTTEAERVVEVSISPTTKKGSASKIIDNFWWPIDSYKIEVDVSYNTEIVPLEDYGADTFTGSLELYVITQKGDYNGNI